MDREQPFASRVRTKIVATVGPACSQPQKLSALIGAGVDVFRVNMAHGKREEHDTVVNDIRRISSELQRPIGILVDLAGPKIRLGTLFEDPSQCNVGEEFRFIRGDRPTARDEFVSNYPRLIDEVNVGNRVMLADGTVSMVVIAKERDSVRLRVTSSGSLRSRQGINLPGATLSVPALTDADISNALWAANQEIDFVSLSFVRTSVEIEQLKKLLRSQGSSAMVVAKIEKGEALQRLDEIVLSTDAVMVARGDLGVEIDIAETPVAQKRIISACQKYSKPVIVATQMLDSMQHSRQPTRAEVSDVANAILDGADACMLSGETAIGDYPVETVEMMNRIMLSTERMLLEMPLPSSSIPALAGVHPITAATVYGAARIAEQLHARLVVISTRSGATARVKAKQRGFTPSIGVSDSAATLRRMSLFWGITPLIGAPVNDGPQLRKFISDWGRKECGLTTGDCIVYVTGSDFVPNAHNLVVVHELE